MPISYEAARTLLDNIFSQSESDLLQSSIPPVAEHIRQASDILFRSATQAHREVLLGCLVARVADKTVNIRQPYVRQGPNAFSGRSLDEKVINPFLQEKHIPSSKGPYLGVFRRSVQFDSGTRVGVRDREAYDALLAVLTYLGSLDDDLELHGILRFVLYKFAELRETSDIPISRLHRISLEQYDYLISGLLATPSGGRFPVLLVVATFNAIKEFFGLDWSVTWQRINVADVASGAAGDITIASGGQTIFAVEVTERPVDRSRVAATFNTKIAPAGIEDYLFFVRFAEVADDAMQQARQYFAQGHEVNFLEIKNWIVMVLATVGSRGRGAFNRALVALVEEADVPKTLKVAWNEQIAGLIG